MSRDDRIILIKINVGRKSYYVIYHVQAAENFKDDRFLLWFLSNRDDVKYTQSVDISKNIISKLESEIIQEYGEPEYGVMEIECNLDEYKDDIKFDRGGIEFIKKFKYPFLDRTDMKPCTAFNY